jgi:hypothetical protein
MYALSFRFPNLVEKYPHLFGKLGAPKNGVTLNISSVSLLFMTTVPLLHNCRQVRHCLKELKHGTLRTRSWGPYDELRIVQIKNQFSTRPANDANPDPDSEIRPNLMNYFNSLAET